jgi:hypothetical protein
MLSERTVAHHTAASGIVDSDGLSGSDVSDSDGEGGSRLLRSRNELPERARRRAEEENAREEAEAAAVLEAVPLSEQIRTLLLDQTDETLLRRSRSAAAGGGAGDEGSADEGIAGEKHAMGRVAVTEQRNFTTNITSLLAIGSLCVVFVFGAHSPLIVATSLGFVAVIATALYGLMARHAKAIKHGYYGAFMMVIVGVVAVAASLGDANPVQKSTDERCALQTFRVLYCEGETCVSECEDGKDLAVQTCMVLCQRAVYNMLLVEALCVAVLGCLVYLYWGFRVRREYFTLRLEQRGHTHRSAKGSASPNDAGSTSYLSRNYSSLEGNEASS